MIYQAEFTKSGTRDKFVDDLRQQLPRQIEVRCVDGAYYCVEVALTQQAYNNLPIQLRSLLSEVKEEVVA